jgi:MFS family permease
MLLLGLWNGGEMLVLSLYLQQVVHMSPLSAGLAIAPQGIIGLATGLMGARLAGRLGIQRVLVLTSVAATAGFAVLTQLPVGGGYHPLLAAVVLVGFGTAGTAFGGMVTASAGIADSDQGVVGGVINTSRQLGAALGAALLPAVAGAVDRAGHGSLAAGDRAAMLAGGVAAGLATLVALAARRKRPEPPAVRPPGRAPLRSPAREVPHLDTGSGSAARGFSPSMRLLRGASQCATATGWTGPAIAAGCRARPPAAGRHRAVPHHVRLPARDPAARRRDRHSRAGWRSPESGAVQKPGPGGATRTADRARAGCLDQPEPPAAGRAAMRPPRPAFSGHPAGCPVRCRPSITLS